MGERITGPDREMGGIEGIKGSEYRKLSDVLPDNVPAD